MEKAASSSSCAYVTETGSFVIVMKESPNRQQQQPMPHHHRLVHPIIFGLVMLTFFLCVCVRISSSSLYTKFPTCALSYSYMANRVAPLLLEMMHLSIFFCPFLLFLLYSNITSFPDVVLV